MPAFETVTSTAASSTAVNQQYTEQPPCLITTNNTTGYPTGCVVTSGDNIVHTSTSTSTKVLSRHGSPTSSRSVSFLCEEVMGESGKKKKFKPQSVSVGDSIHEHVESTVHTERDSSAHVATVFKGSDRLTGRLRSTSTDSITSKHSCFSNTNGLPEVESDRLTNLENGLISKKLSVSNSYEGGKLLSSSASVGDNSSVSKTASFGAVLSGSSKTAKAKIAFFGSDEVSSNRRPVNQIDSCPALMCDGLDPIVINEKVVDSIHSKSTSLRTIPDPPPLKRSKVTIDGQKQYQRHDSRTDSSADSMLHSSGEMRGSCSSAGSDNSTCELLGAKCDHITSHTTNSTVKYTH